MTRHRLTPGDPAPWFTLPSLGGNRDYAFASTAGRHVVMLLYGSAERGAVRAALKLVAASPLFDDRQAAFFGVSTDPEDVTQNRIAFRTPGIRHFIDGDAVISRAFGALPPDAAGPSPDRHDPHWLLLDPALRVLAAYPLDAGERALVDLARAVAAREERNAPVLDVPRIFEPELCRTLIRLYEEDGGKESGFMREVDGKTVMMVDHSHKRRSDCEIADAALRQTLRARISRRLVPMVERAFQFKATRVERYIVACYDAGAGGHFKPHRDNTTRGTAHRRFAVTINLNAEDFAGGELRFPEFGTRSYRASTGGAVVFSCSLLHEALPVTAGRRYAFLPFLYDEEGAKLREANNQHLGQGVKAYRAG